MNNDSFKFRVWNNIEKKYDEEPFFIDMLGDLIKISDFDDNIDRVQNKDNFTIEQCTGLKDKNGKLIFEGDVVKTKDFGKDIDNSINVNDYDTFVVKFSACSFRIENGSREFLLSCRPKLEIIGNIHNTEIDK